MAYTFLKETNVSCNAELPETLSHAVSRSWASHAPAPARRCHLERLPNPCSMNTQSGRMPSVTRTFSCALPTLLEISTVSPLSTPKERADCVCSHKPSPWSKEFSQGLLLLLACVK